VSAPDAGAQHVLTVANGGSDESVDIERRGESELQYAFHGGNVRADAAADGGPAQADGQTNEDANANGRTATAAADCRAVDREAFGIKLDFQEFSGEPKEWNAWSKIYLVQISALGCQDVLTIPAGDDVRVVAENIDGSQFHP